MDVYSKENKSFFEENGYLKLTNILDTKQITFYDKVYSDSINKLGLRLIYDIDNDFYFYPY